MLLSITAGLALAPAIWLIGALAAVAANTLAGEARIHYTVRRLTRPR